MEENISETSSALVALSQKLAAVVERSSPSVVAVDARRRVPTSGVIWRPGVVVSTNHTVERDEEITVALDDGRVLQATLAGRDPGADLTALRVEGADAAAQTGDASTLKVGNIVLAVGRANPERGVSASLGIVSLLGGKWRTWRGGEIDQLIRLDLAIYLGFSGGALLDAEGRVIGVNTSGLARGVGVTVPASTVDRVVDQLLASGRVARPYLGVGMQPVAAPEKLRGKFNLPAAGGLMMLSVEPEAPAERAGIIIGDILLALDDQPTPDIDDVQAALAGREVGQEVKAKILHGGELQEVTITLGERPQRGR